MKEGSLKPKRSGEGSAALIGVTITMVVMGGGLLFWKLGASTKVEAQPPASVPSTPPVAARPLELVPPPPPPPEEPTEVDAGTAQQAPLKKRAGRGPCEPPCDGKVTGPLQSALRARAGQARRCYERALRQNPSLRGSMTLEVQVGREGQVCGVGVGANTLGDPGVTACATSSFQGAQLPPPQGGCVTAGVPVNFLPQEQ